jgi:hypothetical protein
MPRATVSSTPDSCPICAGTALVRRITTYPVRLTGPAPLSGKEIHVNRVALHAANPAAISSPRAPARPKSTGW